VFSIVESYKLLRLILFLDTNASILVTSLRKYWIVWCTDRSSRCSITAQL